MGVSIWFQYSKKRKRRQPEATGKCMGEAIWDNVPKETHIVHKCEKFRAETHKFLESK